MSVSAFDIFVSTKFVRPKILNIHTKMLRILLSTFKSVYLYTTIIEK